jgi:chromosome segregation ATPase
LNSNSTKISQQKNKLVQKLKEVTDENDKFQEQIARLASSNQKQNEEIYQLNNKLNDLNNKEKVINDRCKSKFEILHKEIETKDEQLEKLYTQLRAKDETVKFFSVNQDQNIKNQGALHDELEQLRKDKFDMHNRVSLLQKQLDEFYINRKSEAGMLLELEHLKDDNKRLLNLLKNTEEYKDFAYLAEDCSGGIKYVHSENKTRVLTTKPKKKDKFSKGDDPNNEENWVPNEAYTFTHDFKNKYKLEMNEDLISDLLASVNIN